MHVSVVSVILASDKNVTCCRRCV